MVAIRNQADQISHRRKFAEANLVNYRKDSIAVFSRAGATKHLIILNYT